MRDLLLLDMDGVVFQGSNFWLELHKKMGTVDLAQDLWRQFQSRTISYQELSQTTALAWKGRSADSYFELIRTRRYVAGIRQVVEQAKKQGIFVVIVSSGPWHLASRAHEELGLNEFYGNKLEIDCRLHFAGKVDVSVVDDQKDVMVRYLQKKHRINGKTIVIGDSVSDVAMANLANLSIGFDVSESIRNDFDYVITGNSIGAASQMIQGSTIY